MSFWSRLDKFLIKVEKKGFNFANKAHYYTINIILLSCAYGIYTMFSDYNSFFKDARQLPPPPPEYSEQQERMDNMERIKQKSRM